MSCAKGCQKTHLSCVAGLLSQRHIFTLLNKSKAKEARATETTIKLIWSGPVNAFWTAYKQEMELKANTSRATKLVTGQRWAKNHQQIYVQHWRYPTSQPRNPYRRHVFGQAALVCSRRKSTHEQLGGNRRLDAQLPYIMSSNNIHITTKEHRNP